MTAAGGGDELDRALLAMVAVGDEDGLRLLLDRHGAALLAYLGVLLGDRSAAEDVLQDTLVGVWRGAAGFRGGSSVRTWLFAVARRQATRTRRGRALVGIPDGGQAAGGQVEPSAGPEQLAVLHADVAAVVAAIGTLSPIHREVLVLACVQEMTGPQIAAVLDVPVGTVKSRLSLARVALSAELARGVDARSGGESGE